MNRQSSSAARSAITVAIPIGTDMNQNTSSKPSLTPKLEDYMNYRITDSTPIEEPVPVITINGEVISTEGNLTTFSGPSKSGKSAVSGFLLAGAISDYGHISDPLEGMEVAPNLSKKAVVHIDTEQARHKHQYNVRSILRRANLVACPDHFLSYNIRQMDHRKYARFTEDLCAAAEAQFGGIHLVVVDGIADYISDVNDPEQSNAIVKFFEELAIRYRVPIVVIVHTNPGSDKERGHLGSQCQRKSESVLTVKCEGDVSYLEPKLLRMAGKGDIPLLQFRYDKAKGYHVPCGVKTGGEQDKDARRIEEARQLAAKVFASQIALKYEDALESIMFHSNKAVRTAKDIFRDIKAHKMIKKGTDGCWRLALIKEV